jgi:hypothetical protein
MVLCSCDGNFVKKSHIFETSRHSESKNTLVHKEFIAIFLLLQLLSVGEDSFVHL